jgi:hypothetical protein
MMEYGIHVNTCEKSILYAGKNLSKSAGVRMNSKEASVGKDGVNIGRWGGRWCRIWKGLLIGYQRVWILM